MPKLRLQDLDLNGKKVLMRVDFNVPLNTDGSIADDTRLKESLPSIQHVLNSGGRLILMSHLGRPKGVPDPKLSLSRCAIALSSLLRTPVFMAEDCVGIEIENKVNQLKQGEILVLENLRFHAAEEEPSLDPSFSRQLSQLADVFVNDAFATAHRAHSSTFKVASYFPKHSAAGLLMQKEIYFFENMLAHPKHPFYAIIGGAKISTKMGVLKSLLNRVDAIFIGGAMAFTLLKVKGHSIGKSLVEDDQMATAIEFLNECSSRNIPCHLPIDIIIADAFKQGADQKTVLVSQGIPPEWQGMDIGPQTIAKWKSLLRDAKTLFWNGPLGVFEFSDFARGTEEIAKTVSNLNAITVVGGGDSVAAINRFGLAPKFSHVSTGGGSGLEFIEFGHLPGIDALTEVSN